MTAPSTLARDVQALQDRLPHGHQTGLERLESARTTVVWVTRPGPDAQNVHKLQVRVQDAETPERTAAHLAEALTRLEGAALQGRLPLVPARQAAPLLGLRTPAAGSTSWTCNTDAGPSDRRALHTRPG